MENEKLGSILFNKPIDLSDISLIEKTILFIRDTHKKHADGCKGSCSQQTISFTVDSYYGNHWSCSFGGYCFGDLSRHETVQALSLEELYQRVVQTIDEALRRQDQSLLEDE